MWISTCSASLLAAFNSKRWPAWRRSNVPPTRQQRKRRVEVIIRCGVSGSLIASPQIEENNAVWHEVESAGAVPRRVTALFIAKLEGLTQRQGLCCPIGWLSCVHPVVAQGPIYLPVGLPLCTEGHSPRGHFSLR
jgi:hypothetical protein